MKHLIIAALLCSAGAAQAQTTPSAEECREIIVRVGVLLRVKEKCGFDLSVASFDLARACTRRRLSPAQIDEAADAGVRAGQKYLAKNYATSCEVVKIEFKDFISKPVKPVSQPKP